MCLLFLRRAQGQITGIADGLTDGVFVGVGLGLLPEDARDLILGAAIFSIVLNPLVFLAADKWAPRTAPAETEPAKKPSSYGRAIIVGHGRVGSRIA